MNLEALLRGDPEETLVDQWPDYLVFFRPAVFCRLVCPGYEY
jgi:hypothetical protein